MFVASYSLSHFCVGPVWHVHCMHALLNLTGICIADIHLQNAASKRDAAIQTAVHKVRRHCSRKLFLMPNACAGNTSSVVLMVTYLVAIHNNSVLLLLFGLPFDRALPWHKLLAFSSLFNSLVHMSAFYYGGRASGLPRAQPDADHHIFEHLTRAYGMEITGALMTLFSPLLDLQPLCMHVSVLAIFS